MSCTLNRPWIPGKYLWADCQCTNTGDCSNFSRVLNSAISLFCIKSRAQTGIGLKNIAFSLAWKFSIFTCVAEGESRSRSAVTPSVCPPVCSSVRPKILSSQLLWNYWSIYHETWYVDRTSYGVMHIGRKFWSPHFVGSYAPWNLENIRKSTNNLSFLCQFFINEITASDAGPDIIRSHLFL